MDPHYYLKECIKHARKAERRLVSVVDIWSSGREINELEYEGVLHILQTIIENSIGKAKIHIKLTQNEVTDNAYDAFEVLNDLGIISKEELLEWKLIIGLRNSIVHEYFEIDEKIIKEIIIKRKYEIITSFLKTPF